MKHKTISLEEYRDQAFSIWYEKESASDQALDKVFKFASGTDVFTPLEKGKEQLLETMIEAQPKTGELLMNGGELFVGCARPIKPPRRKNAPPEALLSLYIEVNGRLIELGCSAARSSNLGRMSDDLPQAIRSSYYSEIGLDGLVLPDRYLSPGNGRLLPMPVSNGWPTINNCFKWLRLDDELLLDFAKSLDLQADGKDYFGLRVFLVHFSSDDAGYEDSDILLVNRSTSELYHIGNGKVGGLRILEGYEEAIDNYCHSIINGEQSRFDFTPYLGRSVL